MDIMIGYAIIVASLFFIALFSVYTVYLFSSSGELRIFKIEKISNLRIDDPIKLRGVTVGKLKEIVRKNKEIFVTFEMTRQFVLYDNCKIKSKDRGVMGERIIDIYPGDSTHKIVPLTDTLNAEYETGMSDMLGKAYKLSDMVASAREELDKIYHGRNGTSSLPENIKRIEADIDSIVNLLYRTSFFLNGEMSTFVDSLNSITNRTQILVKKVDSKVLPAEKDLIENMASLDTFINKLSSVSDTIYSITDKLAESKFITNDELSNISNNLEKLSESIEDIRKKSLKLRGVIKFGGF